MKKIFLFFALVLMAGCQQMPTKIVAEESVVSESPTAEMLIKGQPVILDARPAFEFNLAHVPGAINVRWEDFSQNNPRFRGQLQKDLFALARRLSLIGIDLDTKVLVLGKGPQGSGEEGRIAWTLKVLGVKEVHTLLHTSYREMNKTSESPNVANKPYWKPSVQELLTTDLKTMKALAAKPGTVIIDVRTSEEFSLRHLTDVQAQVLNVVWTEFFDEKGLPKKSMESFLSGKNISKDTPVYVISNHGVRSGAVTYALNYLGYARASNFAGGYEQWK